MYHRAVFGIGSITAIDASTPNQALDIAIIRGITIEMKSTEKPLIGNQRFPIDMVTVSSEITGKIQTADSLGSIATLAIPGTTSSTGRAKMALESSAVPTTPYQITVTHSADFRKDLGVVDVTSGKRLARVASAPATGQYSVSAGVYTFAAADTTHTMAIRYSYNDTTTGVTRTFANQAVGATTGYQLEVYDPQGGTREEGYFFPAVKFGSASGGLKSDDWTDSSLDFACFADATGKVFDIWSDE